MLTKNLHHIKSVRIFMILQMHSIIFIMKQMKLQLENEETEFRRMDELHRRGEVKIRASLSTVEKELNSKEFIISERSL